MKLGSNLNADQKQILNALLHPVAADPVTPSVGQAWFRSDLGELRIKGSTASLAMAVKGEIRNAEIAADAAIVLTKLATDPLARGNHTGTTTVAASLSDFATQRDAQRLDQHAVPTAPVAMNNQQLSGLPTPLNADHAANKGYVDTAVTGLDWKQSVRAASTGVLTLSGAQTVDGVALVAGDRALAKDQAAATNGVYIVATGAWTRAADMDLAAEFSGAVVPVEAGTVNADKLFIQTVDAVTVGTTIPLFTPLSSGGTTYTAGTGITITGSSIALTIPVAIASGGTGATDAAAARTNLGASAKIAADITGNATATTFTVTHGLNTRDIDVVVKDATTMEWVLVDWNNLASLNSVDIVFAVAPANAKVYRVVVVG